MHGLDRRKGVAALVPAAAAAALIALTLVQPGHATPRATSATTCTQHGTVTFGVAGGAIPALDPNTIASAAQWTIQPLLYNGLTKYAHDGSVLPELATRWKHSADLKTWWFFLRHDVKYADGRPLHRQGRRREHDARSRPGHGVSGTRQHQGRAVGPRDRRVRGPHQDRQPELDLPGQVFLTKMSDVANIASKDPKLAGNGTGPYKVQSFTPDQTLSLVPNPNYCGPEAVLQRRSTSSASPTRRRWSRTSRRQARVWRCRFRRRRSQGHRATRTRRSSSRRRSRASQAWEVDTTSPPFNNVGRPAGALVRDRPRDDGEGGVLRAGRPRRGERR